VTNVKGKEEVAIYGGKKKKKRVKEYNRKEK
jgi:hypothetical protein